MTASLSETVSSLGAVPTPPWAVSGLMSGTVFPRVNTAQQIFINCIDNWINEQ